MNYDMRVSISHQALLMMADRIDSHANNIEFNITQANRTIESLIGTNVFEGSSASVLLWRHQQMRFQSLRLAARVREYARRIRLTAEAIKVADAQAVFPGTSLMCVPNTFLQNGGEWVIRRKDGKTTIYFRSPDGTETEIPASASLSADDLLNYVGLGSGEFSDGTKILDLKLQSVSESERAAAYMRRLPGWASEADKLKGISKGLGTVGDLIDVGLIGYDGYRYFVGGEDDYYQVANVGTSGNGLQFSISHKIEGADDSLAGNFGGIAGGAAGVALAGLAITALASTGVGIPAAVALGAAFLGGVGGSVLGDEAAKAGYNTLLDSDPNPPPTVLRFTANGAEGLATNACLASGANLDLAQLLDADGEVVIRRDASGQLLATGGVNGAAPSTVYLGN